MSKKKLFSVEENETIEECLSRMEKEGYAPARRMEKPVFKEKEEEGNIVYVPIGREIVFEGKKIT